MKMLLLLLSVFASSCATQTPSTDRPTPKASAFFTDYVKSDGPSPDTLPVFLSACRGDFASLDAIFSDYQRFGSGDNEAWCDVPDVLLEEIGDEQFSSYGGRLDLERKIAVLQWLGPPGSTLYEESELRLRYPKTAALQRELFALHPTAHP